MTEKELLVETIREAVDEAFSERFSRYRSEDPDYEERVAWVRSQIQRDKDNHEMRKKVITSSVGWALPLFIAFIAIAIWHEVASAIAGGR